MHLVLTCNPKVAKSPTERAQMMSRAFNLLVKRIKYHTGLKRLPFYLVVEQTDLGEPHFHILLRAPYIEQRWLSEQWEDLTGAFEVWVEHIKNPMRAARYITKYITKAPMRFGTMKRTWRSKDWERAKPLKPEHDWKRAETRVMQNVGMAWMLKLLRDDGWTIIRAGPDGLEAKPPYEGAIPPLWSTAVEVQTLPKRRKKADWAREAA
jgi:hypothetical protein